MKEYRQTQKLLMDHFRNYPQMQVQDLLKFVHQSAFGCEHMVASPEVAAAYIRKEWKSCAAKGEASVDALDGGYGRVSLSWLDCGLSAETLGRLLFASAVEEPDGAASAERKLAAAEELIREGKLPLSHDEFYCGWEKWKADGYPAVHHSEEFRRAYSPAYRVVAKKYIPFLPLFCEIDRLLQKGTAVVAVEGGSASGKTTLSQMLRELYGCTVFHMDDFFLRPEQRTPQRYAEVGGNVDRERFLQEVLVPLREKRTVCYRRFDCATFALSSPVEVAPERLTVVEGAYSMHPELADYYDFSVFLDISSQLQRRRILKRNSPELAERFFREWIPMEENYFADMQVQQRCDLSVSICE